MPRSSSIQSSKLSSPTPFRPTNPPPVVYTPPTPTTGQIVKQSIASGIGSGIGFSAGQRVMSSLFGSSAPPASAVVPPAATNSTELEKCMEHMATTHREELPLCFNLIKQESEYREFKSCMKITNNNTELCKELLPFQ